MAGFANGYNLLYRVNVDGLAILYMSIAAGWTLILIPGIVCLLRNRHLPFLRIRNVPLSIGAVCCLHIYWILCMFAYTMNGFFPCSTEYWIMSIYLPLGIALFQAANSQLLYVSRMQKKYAQAASPETKPLPPRPVAVIGLGMILQFVCTLIIFLISRKFHPEFGLTGVRTTAGECRRGWEWFPSIAWQFTWAWLYAPYLLWKVRNINDVHGWRLQTILCSVAGMPGSPLWLCALYIKPMRISSTYFVPPLWFSPGIVFMQGFLIFLPCLQVYKNRRLETETRQIIAEWEHKKRYGTSMSSGSTKASSKSRFSLKSTKSSSSTRSGQMYTMTTLEKTLRLNSKPLLLFAALKDFSGENISFLAQVNEWKQNWVPISPQKTAFGSKIDHETRDEEALLRSQFILAAHIYSSFVSLQHSNFPINLSSAHLKELEILFDDTATAINGDEDIDSATPFDNWSAKPNDLEHGATEETQSENRTLGGDSATTLMMTSPERKHYSQVQAFQLSDIEDTLPADLLIPAAFGPQSFDNAERSIKELVLTNTWPKFVNAGYANSMQRRTIKERLASCRDEINAYSSVMGQSWNKGLKKLEISSV